MPSSRWVCQLVANSMFNLGPNGVSFETSPVWKTPIGGDWDILHSAKQATFEKSPGWMFITSVGSNWDVRTRATGINVEKSLFWMFNIWEKLASIGKIKVWVIMYRLKYSYFMECSVQVHWDSCNRGHLWTCQFLETGIFDLYEKTRRKRTKRISMSVLYNRKENEKREKIETRTKPFGLPADTLKVPVHSSFLGADSELLSSQPFLLFCADILLESPNRLLTSTQEWSLIWWRTTLNTFSTVVSFVDQYWNL